jgi:hypothetical protein
VSCWSPRRARGGSISHARLLAETARAGGACPSANITIRAHSSSVERAAAAHDRLTALVLRGGGVEDVAAAVTDVLGGALLALDAEGRQLAKVGEIAEPDRADIVEAVAASRTEGRSVRRGPLWYAAVVAGAENLGALVLRLDDELVAADQRILERRAGTACCPRTVARRRASGASVDT